MTTRTCLNVVIEQIMPFSNAPQFEVYPGRGHFELSLAAVIIQHRIDRQLLLLKIKRGIIKIIHFDSLNQNSTPNTWYI